MSWRTERKGESFLWRGKTSHHPLQQLQSPSSNKHRALGLSARWGIFVFAEFWALARRHSCSELTERILRKIPEDVGGLWGGQRIPQRLVPKNCAKSMFQTLTGSSLLWMIYTWSIWLRWCPTVNRWRRDSKGRPGVMGETNYIKVAQQHLHEQNFRQLQPKVTLVSIFFTCLKTFLAPQPLTTTK